MTTQRTFTPAEFAAAAKAALDNWDWRMEAQEGRSSAYIAAMKDALDFGDVFVANNWADDNGEIVLPNGFGDVWDFLYEFAVSTADNSVR